MAGVLMFEDGAVLAPVIIFRVLAIFGVVLAKLEVGRVKDACGINEELLACTWFDARGAI